MQETSILTAFCQALLEEGALNDGLVHISLQSIHGVGEAADGLEQGDGIGGSGCTEGKQVSVAARD